MMQIRGGRSLLLPLLKRCWLIMFVQPYYWLFLCFFQPTRFAEECEAPRFAQRLRLMLRLALPMLLLCWLFAFPVQLWLKSCVPTCQGFALPSLTASLVLEVFQATLIGVTCGVLLGALGETGMGILLGLALGITGVVIGDAQRSLVKGLVVAGALGLIAGTGRGFQWGIWRGIIGSLLAGSVWVITSFAAQGSVVNSGSGVVIGGIFLISYIVGYYRLPLYLVSGPSALWAYIASRKEQPVVFRSLHSSSLYWDECVFLSLPRLQQTLLIAVGQDVQQALKEVTFIVEQRPQQQYSALVVACEIALRDMEARETIRDIANATQRLQEILPQQLRQVEKRWMTPFNHLADASREAARSGGPLNLQARRAALGEMIAALERIYAHTALPETQLNLILERVVKVWRNAALYQQEKLEQGLESVGQIINPYNPGHTSVSQETPFVGRTDIARQLSEALSKAHRPTFLLNGERRMGKSTLLHQLPRLLGSTSIPIFYDLQNPGVTSSIDTFLSKLAESIQKEASLRGISIEKLDRTRLQEALRKNEAAIYAPFDEWLDRLEQTLVGEKRIVLLLFDEFEKLEEAGLAEYLNLPLLLDWFRNTIQNRRQIALLFSGVRTFGELSTNWARYFVNAKTLKMSFLQPAETRHLITQPVVNFPSQELYSEEVITEIMRVTGCHPFLVQAVCSELIDHLNLENRQCATVDDLDVAVTHVLTNWWDTYFRDLWKRTDEPQRACLQVLSQQEANTLATVTLHSFLDEQTAQQALDRLVQRDVATHDQRGYTFAAPIFRQWVERNNRG